MKGRKNGKTRLTKGQRMGLWKAIADGLKENGLNIIMNLLYLILAVLRCL